MKGEIAENAEAIDIGDEGKAIVRHNGIVVFVKGLVPGDVADIEILKVKKKFAEGRIVEMKKPSANRTKPVCSHFGSCGGCSWQNLDYARQIALKQRQAEQAFKRIGGVDTEKILPIIGSKEIYHYRNKLEFTFSSKRWLSYEEMEDKDNFGQPGLGFHVPKLFDKIIDLKECHLQPDPSDAIRKEVRDFTVKEKMPYFDIREQYGFLRNLIIRTTSTGEIMVVVVFFHEDKPMREKLMKHIQEKFPGITSLLYIINPKKNDSISDLEADRFAGQMYITEQLTRPDGKKLNFRVSPQSFFQTNTAQANALYAKVSEFAALKGTETVFDLYTGCGTIASFIAPEAAHVVGIEYVEQAVKDARKNAELNNIKNIDFEAGDMKDMLTEEFCRHYGRPQVVITDPPRSGMHPDVVGALMKMHPEKIVYVSCNPATQARDVSLLSEKYDVKLMQPVDMFPHTSHVENIALLVKR